MNETTTQEVLQEAEAAFTQAEQRLAVQLSRSPTAEGYLLERQLRTEVEKAARAAVAARDEHERAAAAERAKQEREIRDQLDSDVAALRKLASIAEEQMADLAKTLGEIMTLSRSRYSNEHRLHGSAPRAYLGQGLAPWVQFRLADLNLSDLGRAPRHHRADLEQILGLGEPTSTEEVNR